MYVFISRYCTLTTQADGNVVVGGARSKRGKMRGPPGSRTWNSALKNLVGSLRIVGENSRFVAQRTSKNPIEFILRNKGYC